jgi:cysteinyl-tRNA synthetase
MSTAYLGSCFELHGGGADLAFPHHEAERAQSEAATGERPFVGWWMHAGMLHHEGAKMSKSLGNLVLVRDLLRDHSGDTIRHYLISHHYRAEVHYDRDALERSAAAAALLREASALAGDPVADVDPAIADARERFLAAMEEDLDTPTAMAELESLARLAVEADDALAAQAGAAVRELGGRILGLRLATVPKRSPVAA